MRKSKIIESIRIALGEKRLQERFDSKDFKRAYPGFAENTYPVFLAKHRVGNPGGYTEYFKQHSDGKYSLLSRYR